MITGEDFAIASIVITATIGLIIKMKKRTN